MFEPPFSSFLVDGFIDCIINQVLNKYEAFEIDVFSL